MEAVALGRNVWIASWLNGWEYQTKQGANDVTKSLVEPVVSARSTVRGRVRTQGSVLRERGATTRGPELIEIKRQAQHVLTSTASLLLLLGAADLSRWRRAG